MSVTIMARNYPNLYVYYYTWYNYIYRDLISFRFMIEPCKIKVQTFWDNFKQIDKTILRDHPLLGDHLNNEDQHIMKHTEEMC